MGLGNSDKYQTPAAGLGSLLSPVRTEPRRLVPDPESLALRGHPPSLPSLCPRRALLRGGTFCELDLEVRPAGPGTCARRPGLYPSTAKSTLRRALRKASSGCIYPAGRL